MFRGTSAATGDEIHTWWASDEPELSPKLEAEMNRKQKECELNDINLYILLIKDV